jgi:hypothetical protein
MIFRPPPRASGSTLPRNRLRRLASGIRERLLTEIDVALREQ